MRSSGHVRDLLTEKGIDHELVELSGRSCTAASAVDLSGAPIAAVARSLLSRADGDPALVPRDLTVHTGLPARVLGRDVMYCGGGTATTMLKARGADLAALLWPLVARVGAGPVWRPEIR